VLQELIAGLVLERRKGLKWSQPRLVAEIKARRPGSRISKSTIQRLERGEDSLLSTVEDVLQVLAPELIRRIEKEVGFKNLAGILGDLYLIFQDPINVEALNECAEQLRKKENERARDG
jgi:transcriptional regulator with XRE-family HTH domain